MTSRKIKKLFIANRGEIARRIALGAKGLDIESAVVSSRPTPPHFLVGLVDHFIRVPEENPALYLNVSLMVKLAVEAECDAVHPGFGFLSENAAFAQAVIDAGLTWVGPPPSAITAMASKDAARQLAIASGVPVVPGLRGITVDPQNPDLSSVEAFARTAGYPLLIKAALGGGGKGMRRVNQESELREATLRASSEAKNSFGDGSVIIERYLTTPRHVEVQVLGDLQGRVITVGDRDCSIQRRHQKIIEEAPAPYLSEATRRAMHDAALQLARKVGYSSAGTVEFLVDWSDKSRTAAVQDFYFLEMNTRLQVEHPVTEEVYGLDLVGWQLRIAQGESIPAAMEKLEPRGHAVEARIYAEDVTQNFFPSPGPILGFNPHFSPGIRWEVGIDPIDEVSPAFDPMVAKAVAFGSTREESFRRLGLTLSKSVFFGPPNNIALLRQILADELFLRDPVGTHYIDQNLPRLLAGMESQRQQASALSHDLLELLENNVIGAKSPTVMYNYLDTPRATTSQIFSSRSPRESHPYDIITSYESFHNHPSFPGCQSAMGRGLVKSKEHGAWKDFAWVNAQTRDAHWYWIGVDGETFARSRPKGGLQAGSKSSGGGDQVAAPVPGKVVKILVNPGDTVAKRQTVLILESMKMEFEVQAPKAGVIGALKVNPGDQVNADDLLMTWES